MGGWVVSTTPRPPLPRERSGTHCTGGWVGLGAGLDRCGKSRPHRDSIPGPSARSESLYRLSHPGSPVVNKLYKIYWLFEILSLKLLSRYSLGENIEKKYENFNPCARERDGDLGPAPAEYLAGIKGCRVSAEERLLVRECGSGFPCTERWRRVTGYSAPVAARQGSGSIFNKNYSWTYWRFKIRPLRCLKWHVPQERKPHLLVCHG